MAAGTELLYLVVANLFLSLGGISKMLESTSTISVRFERAWTIWPGRVHVRNLRIVFQDLNLQWSLDIPSAHVVLQLNELVSRTFHAQSVQAEGVVFRVRHRVDPWSANLPSVRVLPQIPEFPGTAVFEARVPEAPVTDANYNLWTVHLEHVDAGVSEVWIQQFRYVGSGRARGAFRLRPARTLWVGPASLDLDPGRLTVGTYQVSPALAGRIECVVHPFDVKKPVGREVLRFISAHVRLWAPDVSLSASRLFLPEQDARVRAEGGELRVDARTDHGRFVSSSQLELSQRRLVLEHARFKLELGRGSLVARAGPDGRGQAVLVLTAGKLTLPNSDVAPLNLDVIRASMPSSSLDTAGEWSVVETNLLEARISAPDVRWFNGLLSQAGWTSSGGASELSARARYRDGELEGDARVALRNVSARSARTSLTVDGRASISWSAARIPERSGIVSGSFIGTRLRVEQPDALFDANAIALQARAQAFHGEARGRLALELGKMSARSAARAMHAEGVDIVGDVDAWDMERQSWSSRFAGELRNVDFRASAPKLSAHAARTFVRGRVEQSGRAADRKRNFDSRLSMETTLDQVRIEQGASVFRSGGVRVGAKAQTLHGASRVRLTVELGKVRGRSGNLTVEAEGGISGSLETTDRRRGLQSSGFAGELRNVDLRAPDSEIGVRAKRASFIVRMAPSNQQGAASLGLYTTLNTTLYKMQLEQGFGQGRTDARADELSVSSHIASRANGELDGALRASARGFQARSGRTRFEGSPELDVSVTALNPREQRGRMHADLVVHSFSANDAASDRDCPWSSIAVGRLRADAELRGDVGARLRVAGDLSRVRLAWGDFRTTAEAAHFETDFGEPVPGRTGKVFLSLALREAKLRNGRGAPLGWEATVPTLNLKAALSRTAASFAGPVQLDAEHARARIGRTSFGADLAATVSLAALEPQLLQARGTGSVRIRHLGLKLDHEEVKDWWANVGLDSVSLSVHDNLDVVGTFRAKLRDALPALRVLAAQGEIPGWVPEVFPLRELEATGMVARRCRVTEVRVSELKGGPLTSRGRVQSVLAAVRGAFLVRWVALNPISAGISFGDKDSGLSLFAGNDWVTREFHALDVAGQSQSESCTPAPPECGGD